MMTLAKLYCDEMLMFFTDHPVWHEKLKTIRAALDTASPSEIFTPEAADRLIPTITLDAENLAVLSDGEGGVIAVPEGDLANVEHVEVLLNVVDAENKEAVAEHFASKNAAKQRRIK